MYISIYKSLVINVLKCTWTGCNLLRLAVNSNYGAIFRIMKLPYISFTSLIILISLTACSGSDGKNSSDIPTGLSVETEEADTVSSTRIDSVSESDTESDELSIKERSVEKSAENDTLRQRVLDRMLEEKTMNKGLDTNNLE